MDVLAAAPRRRAERILGLRRFGSLVGRGWLVAGLVLGTAWWMRARGWDMGVVQSQLFVALLVLHLLLAYVSRGERAAFERGWLNNRALLAAIGGSAALVAVVMLAPPLRVALGASPLPPVGWALAALAATALVLLVDGARWVLRRARRAAGGSP